MSHLLLPFNATPVEEIATITDRLRSTFLSHKTQPLAFRELQLRKLYYALKDNEQRIVEAMRADLHKPAHETYMTEIIWLQNDILYMLDNLRSWAKDEKGETSLVFKLMKPRIEKQPMGLVLIMGAFNYPLQLVLAPFIGAIAAGCTVVIKPSEMAPHTAALVGHILAALDQSCYAVVNGGIQEATALLDQKWDKILYTGNGIVGRIIAKKAAETLTPVILELGGLNPVIVTSNADPKIAARRIAWGKVHNAGQICLSPDYILVHPSQVNAFIESYISSIKTFYPNGAKDSPDFGHIINARHFNRIKKLLEDTKGTILCGGETDEATNFIAPTLVRIEDLNDSLMSEEIFGPVLPMLVISDLDKMLETIRTVGDTPLAAYVFSNDKEEQDKFLRVTRSGGASVNDVMIHGGISSLPFGGVGESGTGSYRGRASFDAFSHRRTVVTQPLWLEGQMASRYPPYSDKKLKQFRSTADSKPNFDRDGKVYYSSPLAWLLLLGARSKRGGILRYILLFLGAFMAKNWALTRL